MKKYRTIFSLSFQNEFAYRLNFILWRLRNVLRILLTYFLWTSIFFKTQNAFGYSKEQMLTYVFLTMIITAIVSPSPSNDTMSSEISGGDLSNYLVKPISYLNYWLARDWASKLLNLSFATFEFFILYFIFNPHLYFPGLAPIILGISATLMAAFIYFFVTKIFIFNSFWNPENTWGLMFVFLSLSELFSGLIFPLDILPKWLYQLLLLTPFPYIVYFPVKLFVGRLDLVQTLEFFIGGIIWLILSATLVNVLWRKGLKIFSDTGR